MTRQMPFEPLPASVLLGVSGCCGGDAIKLVEVQEMVTVDCSSCTINDNDEEDVRSACANVSQIEAVIGGTIDALDELVPDLVAMQIGGRNRMHIGPNVERRVGGFGDGTQRLYERGVKGCLVELLSCGSHGLISFRSQGARGDA